MSLLVFGAGAVGSVVGGLLSLAGEDVALLGRQAPMEAIRKRGLRIEGIWGEHLARPRAATHDFQALRGGRYEAILLTVRACDTAAALDTLERLAEPETLIVSLQNGLGNCETLAQRFGSERVVGGRVIFGAMTPAPGIVRVTVYAEEVLLGAYDRRSHLDRIDDLAARMSRAGVPTLRVDDVLAYLWAKTLYNGALNPLSALLGWTYGQLGAHAETRAVMDEVIDEIYLVAAAEGVALPQSTAAAYRAHFYGHQVPATAAHRSSMLQAVERGARTEIDALNGYIAARAAAHGIDTPANRLLTRLIHAKEAVCVARA